MCRAVRQCRADPQCEHRSAMLTRGGVHARGMEPQHAFAAGHPAAWCARSEARVEGGSGGEAYQTFGGVDFQTAAGGAGLSVERSASIVHFLIDSMVSFSRAPKKVISAVWSRAGNLVWKIKCGMPPRRQLHAALASPLLVCPPQIPRVPRGDADGPAPRTASPQRAEPLGVGRARHDHEQETP